MVNISSQCAYSDTGAAFSLLLEGVLLVSKESKTGTSVLVCGFEMGSAVVPLHRIELKPQVVIKYPQIFANSRCNFYSWG